MDKILSTKIQNGAVIAAIMVVAIHISGVPLNFIDKGSALWWFEAFGHWGLFLVSVPYFFVCSGYFLAKHIEEKGWWRRECIKRINSLLVPYIAWCIIFAILPFVAFFFANLLHGRITLLDLDLSHHFWIRTFGLSPFRYPGFALLWYVRTLLAFVIVSPVLFYLCKKMGSGWRFVALLYIAAIVVGIGTLYHNKVAGVFFYFFKLQGLVYFCIGALFKMSERQSGTDIRYNVGKGLRWVALGLGALLILIATLATRKTGQDFSNFSCVIFIPPLLFAFWHFVPEKPFPKWLTGNTFAIYLIHGVVLKAICIVHPQQVLVMSQWIIKWVIVFFASVLAAMLLRRLLPRVSCVLFGGR